MKLTYDPRYNIAYIQLREKTQTVDSIKISEELVVDMSADGTIYGIEEASQRFFGKKSMDLTLAESAYLAAIPQARPPERGTAHAAGAVP